MITPILANKNYRAPSVFRAENLLREARRQKGLVAKNIPAICLLDPDGDIVAHLLEQKQANQNPYWACYHTTLYEFEAAGITFGVIGCAVGGPFAVLLAEQLFVSGCELLISITSAGQIRPVRPPPYFVLIDKALRDEGASYHYLPPEKYARLDPGLDAMLGPALRGFSPPIERGASWTTDAPYRETDDAIAFAHAEAVLAVEMESASLYAFAEAKRRPVVCFAHITNRMGAAEGDFEKGAADGSLESLRLIEAVAACWTSTRPSPPLPSNCLEEESKAADWKTRNTNKTAATKPNE